MRTKRLLVGSLATAALVVFAAPSMGESFTVRATDDLAFAPDVRTVHKGDKVVWKNASSLTHTVNAYGGGWKFNQTLEPGAKVSRRFSDKGVFTFRCTVRGHSFVSKSDGSCSGMCGKIKVRR